MQSITGFVRPQAADLQGSAGAWPYPRRAYQNLGRLWTLIRTVATMPAWRRLCALGMFGLVWYLMTAYEVTWYVRFVHIPGPVAVLNEMAKLATSTLFYKHILASLERIYLGFALAACLGIACGVLIGWYRSAADFLFPIIELLRPIPAVAWVPMAIILWPTERASIVYITALGAFFPIVLNTIQGVKAIDPTLMRAATSLGAKRSAMLREVVLPGALPSIVTGLAVGMGVSWVCLISAEMVAGQYGVGYYTWTAYGVVNYPAIVVGMLTIGLLGMGSSALVYTLGTWLMPWRRHVEQENTL